MTSNMTFEEYDNPERAAAIWGEYVSDIERLGVEVRAENILSMCNRSDDLDIRLERLISGRESGLCAPPTSSPVDPDSNGSWGNAVRRLEEQ